MGWLGLPVIIVVNIGLKILSSGVFIDRFIQKDWEAGVPWTGQCWENNPPAHAQRWPAWAACSYSASKYAWRFCQFSCVISYLQAVSVVVVVVLSIRGADHSWDDLYDVWPRRPHTRWVQEKGSLVNRGVTPATWNLLPPQPAGSGKTTYLLSMVSSTWWTVLITSD